MSALEYDDLPAERSAPRVVLVTPAGDDVWYRIPYRDEAGYYRRKVIAWAVVQYDDGEVVEAMLASFGGPYLARASEIDKPTSDHWHRGELVTAEDVPCDCGRLMGDDNDPQWCRECGAVIRA